MGRQSDPRKVAKWGRLVRLGSSGLTVPQLSDRDGVMSAPLRYWLRKLNEAPGGKRACQAPPRRWPTSTR